MDTYFSQNIVSLFKRELFEDTLKKCYEKIIGTNNYSLFTFFLFRR